MSPFSSFDYDPMDAGASLFDSAANTDEPTPDAEAWVNGVLWSDSNLYGAADSHLDSVLVTPPETPSLTHKSNKDAQPQCTLPKAPTALDTQYSPLRSPSSPSWSSGTNGYGQFQSDAPGEIIIPPVAYAEEFDEIMQMVCHDATSSKEDAAASRVPQAATALTPTPVTLQWMPTAGRKDLAVREVLKRIESIISTIPHEHKYKECVDRNGMLDSRGRTRLVKAIRQKILPPKPRQEKKAKTGEDDACRHRVKSALKHLIEGKDYRKGKLFVGHDNHQLPRLAQRIALAIAGYSQKLPGGDD